MFKVDNKNKCTIFAGSFFDDMQKYDLQETPSGLEILYSDGIKENVTFNWGALTNSIDYGLSLSDDLNDLSDVWIPILIDNDNYILSKEIKNNFSIKKMMLGIENFINFIGKFNNWEISPQGQAKLKSDWLINSIDIPYIMDYGILCWYKNNSAYKYTDFKPLSEFPIGSRIICDKALTAVLSETESISISNTDILIKHGENSLILTSKDDSIFLNSTNINSTSANISFNTERKLFNLNKVNNLQQLNPKFRLDIKSLYTGKLEHASLWIADGESYSYSLNKNRRAENYTFNISSLSYLSPSLYYKYNAIFNRLTSRIIRQPNSAPLPQQKLAILKKLCYFLST